MTQPRIQFVTTGSPSLGMGHLRRSATLAHEVAREAEVSVRLLALEEHAAGQPAIGTLLGGMHWEVGFGPRTSGFDLTVLDLPPVCQHGVISRLIHEGMRCLALDYFVPSLLPDLAINLADPRGVMQAAFVAANRAHDFNEGPQFAIVRPSLRLRRPASANPAAEVTRVLVTMGGADPSGQTASALERLAVLVPADVRVDVAMGALATTALEERVRTLADGRFQVHRDPALFDELLSAADVIVCSGGGTLLEALCLGKPAVVYPQNQAERLHAGRYVDEGACVWADRLPEVLQQVEQRRALAQQGLRLIDGRGVERIAAHVLDLARAGVAA